MAIKLLFIFILLNNSFISSIRLKDNDFFDYNYLNSVIKINRLSLSPKNEILMNMQLDSLSTYIKEKDLERKECPKEIFKNIIHMRENFTESEDGTYDLHSHKVVSFDRGYQVSFETAYDDYSEDDYSEIVYKMALMSDNHVYLGVYGGNPEFSFYFQDLPLARTLAIMYKQISIWDWSVMDEIFNPYCPYS